MRYSEDGDWQFEWSQCGADLGADWNLQWLLACILAHPFKVRELANQVEEHFKEMKSRLWRHSAHVLYMQESRFGHIVHNRESIKWKNKQLLLSESLLSHDPGPKSHCPGHFM